MGKTNGYQPIPAHRYRLAEGARARVPMARDVHDARPEERGREVEGRLMKFPVFAFVFVVGLLTASGANADPLTLTLVLVDERQAVMSTSASFTPSLTGFERGDVVESSRFGARTNLRLTLLEPVGVVADPTLVFPAQFELFIRNVPKGFPVGAGAGDVVDLRFQSLDFAVSLAFDDQSGTLLNSATFPSARDFQRFPFHVEGEVGVNFGPCGTEGDPDPTCVSFGAGDVRLRSLSLSGTPPATPEPSTLILCGTCALAVAAQRWRRPKVRVL